MKTEEEARKLWCPHVRLVRSNEDRVPNGQAAFNRTQEGSIIIGIPDAARCLASGCMAWEWDEAHGELKNKIQAIKDHREKHGSSLKVAKEWVEENTWAWSAQGRKGDCGLKRRTG